MKGNRLRFATSKKTATSLDIIDTVAFSGGWYVVAGVDGHGFTAGDRIGQVYRHESSFDAVVDGPTVGAAVFTTLEDALDYFAGFVVARAMNVD